MANFSVLAFFFFFLLLQVFQQMFWMFLIGGLGSCSPPWSTVVSGGPVLVGSLRVEKALSQGKMGSLLQKMGDSKQEQQVLSNSHFPYEWESLFCQMLKATGKIKNTSGLGRFSEKVKIQEKWEWFWRRWFLCLLPILFPCPDCPLLGYPKPALPAALSPVTSGTFSAPRTSWEPLDHSIFN